MIGYSVLPLIVTALALIVFHSIPFLNTMIKVCDDCLFLFTFRAKANKLKTVLLKSKFWFHVCYCIFSARDVSSVVYKMCTTVI